MNDRDGYASRIADLLERAATTIRSATVDRAWTAITWVAAGLVAAGLVLLAAYWLFVAVFRALGTLIGVEVAYAVVGALLVILGTAIWWKRVPPVPVEPPASTPQEDIP